MQKHHITYKPEFIVELTGWEHKVITHIQRRKATRENLEKTRAFQMAVNHEVNRIAFQLYEAESKNINTKEKAEKKARNVSR